MGDADKTTPYQAELVSIKLAVADTIAIALPQTDLFWFFTDNKTLIKDLTETSRAKPGMTACAQVRRLLKRLICCRPEARVALIWRPSKKDIRRMTRVDKAAKEVALLPQ